MEEHKLNQTDPCKCVRYTAAGDNPRGTVISNSHEIGDLNCGSTAEIIPDGKCPEMLFLYRNSYGPNESRRILKNLLVLGFAFTMLFSAFMATANLQSSINQEDGLGTYALASIYGVHILTSLFLPPLVIYKFKTKPTLILAVSGYIAYIGAQMYPAYYTLIPAAAFNGFCGAHLWAAKSGYVTKIAEEYARLNKLAIPSVIQRFFGIFFLFFHSAQIWGNLISSSVLSSGNEPRTNITHAMLQNTCGPNYCPSASLVDTGNSSMSSSGYIGHENGSHDSSQLVKPDMSKIYLLFSIYLGCAAAAAIILCIFVDSLERYGELELKSKSKPKATGLLIATIKHWRKPTQILIIPISLWLGIQEAFISFEFTMAYISCAWGVEHIGHVMLTFGISASITSLIFGKLIELVGRSIMFLMAGLIDLGCMITMLCWIPAVDQHYVLFLMAGLWGVADGVWGPQVKALYATIFPTTTEAAFSNAGLWISIGFIIVYLLANRFCMTFKLYLYIGILTLAITCYLLIELIERTGKDGDDDKKKDVNNK